MVFVPRHLQVNPDPWMSGPSEAWILTNDGMPRSFGTGVSIQTVQIDHGVFFQDILRKTGDRRSRCRRSSPG